MSGSLDATQPVVRRPSRLQLAGEIAFFVTLAIVLKQILTLVVWRYAGPLSLYVLIAVLTVHLRRRGLSWRSFGLVVLSSLRLKLLVIPQAFLALIAFAAAVAPILMLGDHYNIAVITTVPDGVEDRFGDVEGDLAMYLLWLGIVWTAAAFGEEMFFRGYLVTRLSSVFEGAPFASVLAIVIAAIIFGCGHMYYQGLRGLIIAGAIAVAFGSVFLLLKKNLWPIIILHGAIDTATFTVTYLGIEPE
ncbi:MAG: lysostaphin resistance A-like protein [Parvularculaceae bacterium]